MLADRMRLSSGQRGVVLPIGEPFAGGFFAGIIDTTRNNIIAADAYQDGLRYALIVSPQALEGGRGTATGDLQWRTSQTTVPGARTRWDGLAAQRALASAIFPAFNYCAGLSFPDDGGSEWYLPALDEMELLYRLLKPTTDSNQTGDRSGGTFPGGTHLYGANPSSDPIGAPYTASIPAQTSVADFQDGGPEAFQDPSTAYLTATWYSSASAWAQRGFSGNQSSNPQAGANRRVRPVRRVLL